MKNAIKPELGLRNYFPEVKFEFTPQKQLYRVLDEMVEAEEALIEENDMPHFLEEMIDVIHTAANVLYKAGFSDEQILNQINAVKEKNYARGKYKDLKLSAVQESNANVMQKLLKGYNTHTSNATNIKFHQLQIIAKTHMAVEYRKHPENFELFGMEEYIDFMVRFLEQLNPKFVVERFTGEVPPRYLVSQAWGNFPENPRL